MQHAIQIGQLAKQTGSIIDTIRTFVLLVSLCSLAIGSTERSSEAAGTYTLLEAAGQRLPAVVSENPATGYKQEVMGGSVVLRPDETFSWRTDYRETSGGRVWEHQSSGGGRYRLVGSTITFEFDNHSGELSGTLRSGLLKMRADVELTLRKQ